MSNRNTVIGRKKQVNFINLVNDFVGELQSNVTTPPLGPDFLDASDADTAERWLCNYRIKKKFCVPSPNSNLAEKSVTTMLEYDNSGLRSFEPCHMEIDSLSRRALYVVRNELHQKLSNFKLNFHCIIPSGETDLSRKGDVSIFAKLANVQNWRVTPDCFDLACTMIYKTRWLKVIAKSHFLKYTRNENYNLAWACNFDGFEIFKQKLLDIITITDGSRVTTVPKNNDEDRCINCEPLFNMMVQSAISHEIRSVLRKHYGYDIETAQMRHRDMISDLSLATIDLSKASDSNWLAVIKWLYPKRFVRFLESARSPVGAFRGANHTFNMLSPMGNGFTFEVMTLTLLTFARFFCDRSSVFGDDIILSKDKAASYIDVLSILGYKINVSKSFTTGEFRESCGGFFFRNRYLKSFDFWYAEDTCDAIVNLNKLIILRKILNIEDALRELLQKVPLLMLKAGTFVENGHESLDSVVYVPEDLLNVKRLKRKCIDWRRRIPVFREEMSNDILNYTYDHRKVDYYVHFYKESCTYLHTRKWREIPIDLVKNKALIGFYLYTGKCSAPIILNKERIKGRLVVY